MRFDPLKWREMVDDPWYCMKDDFKPVPVEYGKVIVLCSTAHNLLNLYTCATLSAANPSFAAEALALARTRAHAAYMLYRNNLVIPPEGELPTHISTAMFQMAKAIDILLLIAWLTGAPIDPALSAEHGRLMLDEMLRGSTKSYRDNISVALAIVALMGHGEWQTIRALVEAHPKFGTDQFKPQRPTQAAYLLATDPTQRTDPKSPALKKAAAHVRANIHELARAHTAMFLHWLRLLEWREGTSGLTPRQVILRAYAYMPDVMPPTEIADEVASLKMMASTYRREVA